MAPEFIKYLQDNMSLTRLATVGLFQKLDTDEGVEVNREIKLHRAVLDKALVDMFSTRKSIKKDVDEWLSLSNPAFRSASERACLDPELVYKLFMLMKKILVGDKARFRKFGPRTKRPNRKPKNDKE